MTIEVIERTAADVCWPFEKPEQPYVLCGKPRGHRTEVDPFPAYPHDATMIERYLRIAAERFPIGWPLSAYVLHLETVSRTNGWAQSGDYDYNERDERGHYKRYPSVVFPAKRIPIHPAMTRYVAVHEYGHIVEAWLVCQQTAVDGRFENTEKRMMDEYGQMRGLPNNGLAGYGGGTWHKTLAEVFANDFRVLVCGVETEFWPHPGIERPENVPELSKWWREARERA